MKKIAVFVLMIGLVGQVGAQTKVLTFEEAVRLMLKNGIILNQQENLLEVNQMQRTASRVALGPNITATGAAFRNDGNSFNPNTGNVVNGVRDNVTGTLNGNINIFSGFRAINAMRQQNQLLDAQLYNVNRVRQDAINTMATQYLNVMLDKELLLIAKENFDALNQQLTQVREQAALGSRSPVDEYNQDAQTKAAELRYVQAEIQLNNDKTTLAQTLLIDPYEDFDVEAPNWDINRIGQEVLDPVELGEKAKQFRGDYMRAIRQEEAQRFGMRSAKGAMMPTLYAFGSIGSAYNYQHNVADSVTVTTYSQDIVFDSSTPTGYAIANTPSSTTVLNPNIPRPFEEQFRHNNVNKQFGVQLNITILNGFQARSNYVQQKKLYENAQLNRKNVEYQIQNDVVRTVRNYDGAKRQYAITLDQLKSAEVAYQLETERYNLGITNFVDYVNANRALVQAKGDKARGEYNLVFQKLLLEYAVGTLKPENLRGEN